MANLERCKPVLGTYVDISLSADTDESTLLSASNAAFEKIQFIHDLMSFHQTGSELSHINRNAFKQTVSISPDMHTVLKTALELSAATDGLYDITMASVLIKNGKLPAHDYAPTDDDWSHIHLTPDTVQFSKNIIIDLGGIAKGYAVDLAFEHLASTNIPFTQITINAGGDIRMLDWKNQHTTLRTPKRFGGTRLVDIDMQNTALATSVPGRGSQSSHIISPKPHTQPKTKNSMTVFAPNCMIADALTKIMYLAPNRTDILQRYNAKAVSVNTRGKIRVTS